MTGPHVTGPAEVCACGAPVGPEERFCEACGADLAYRTAGEPDAAATACGVCGPGGPEGDDGYCPDCGLRLPAAADRVEAAVPGSAGRPGLVGVSDRGLRHHHNEDGMALGSRRDGLRAAVVCDGVSSSSEPERASRAAADAALAVLLHGQDPGPERTIAAVAAAADAVAGLDADQDRPRDDAPACTIVTALVEPDGTVTVGWVGDSRAYWLPDAGPAQLLTRDHSWVAAAVAAGLLDAAAAATDPRAHVITGWLGPHGRRAPDVVTPGRDGPGTLLLCSDGLWNDHPEPAALAALTRGATDPAAAAVALTAAALDTGGHDNITVVLLPVGEP